MTLLLGESGMGKTQLVRALLQRLHATEHAVILTWPADSGMSLIRETCKRFGVTLPDSYNEDRCLARLRRRLRQIRDADHHAILIVDQAENLAGEAVAELRRLVGILSDTQRLLGVILAGHPRIHEAFDGEALAGDHPHRGSSHMIPALSISGTEAYIAHRLHVAGAGDAQLFEHGAVEIIHTASAGIPCRINQMADAALVAAFDARAHHVTQAIAVDVQRQLDPHTGVIDAGVREAISTAASIHQTTSGGADREASESQLFKSILTACQNSIKEKIATEVRVQRQTMEAEIAKFRARVGAMVETSIGNVPAIRQIEELIANALQVNESLQGAVAHADSKIGQLGSHHAAANSVLRRLGEATIAGHERAEELTEAVGTAKHTIKSGQQIVKDVWDTTARTETNVRALTAANKQAMELIHTLGDITETAKQTTCQLSEQAEEAGRRLHKITSQLEDANEIVERLGKVQGMCEVIGGVEASISATSERATETCKTLADATENALSCGKSLTDLSEGVRRLLEGSEQVRHEADVSIERLAEQISTAQQVIDKSTPLLHELITRSRQVHAQIGGLQHRADEIERSVIASTAKPTEIVAMAQDQAEQLERVVGTVQKVFGMLSKASLDAGSKVSEFRRTSEEAQQKLGRLTDDTSRAARTLQMWVEEAVRIQARIERAIRAAPSIAETHSGEVLREVSRSIDAMGRLTHSATSGELAVLREPRGTQTSDPGSSSTGHAGEVTRIIETVSKTEGGE